MPVMVSVESSNLAAVGYDGDVQILEVRFVKGGAYQYFGVPAYIYDGLLSASSKGSYFYQNIKRAGYPYQRVG